MLQLNEMKDFILSKTRENIENFGDRLPNYTKDGKYQFSEDGFWVGGFWAGMEFLCYEMTQDEYYLDAARKSRHRFKKRLYERPGSLDHDIGFLYIPSCVADYKITGNIEGKEMALRAAELLASRFNEAGQFIQAWNVWHPGEPFSEENRGRIIIDCMYNLPLLFWAAEETGNKEYKRIATAHADTCAKYIVRENYTTYHTYVFDHITGKPKYGKTFQGFADESCWARGQSWVIGGFTYAYAYTGDKRYLEIAQKSADFFINSLEEDYVPMWDFLLPNKDGEPRDASAGAIAASGILELAKHLEDDKKEFYISTAKKMLESLYINYSSRSIPEEEGLILHACGHKPENVQTDCSLIYGDYYFVEAVAMLLGKTCIYW